MAETRVIGSEDKIDRHTAIDPPIKLQDLHLFVFFRFGKISLRKPKMEASMLLTSMCFGMITNLNYITASGQISFFCGF
ncbi:unnamed protein product [Cuscuta campestris]|uniref:Uncharacterized protein n=1 Tax=Cuscuta campestris TaxID=132261 RepID=A0A484N0V8_9ASTE|nr:unnamed protein product [Cuscuta campestris]